MSAQRRHERVYRALLRLYPTDFRETYSPELVQLFADQLRDARTGIRGTTTKTWLRTLGDLAATVPSEHARRNRVMAQSRSGRPLSTIGAGLAILDVVALVWLTTGTLAVPAAVPTGALVFIAGAVVALLGFVLVDRVHLIGDAIALLGAAVMLGAFIVWAPWVWWLGLAMSAPIALIAGAQAREVIAARSAEPAWRDLGGGLSG